MTEGFIIGFLLRCWQGHERFVDGVQYAWLTYDQWLDAQPLTALTYPA